MTFPGLTSQQTFRLAQSRRTEAADRKRVAGEALRDGLYAFAEETRALLKSEDDVAPSVPPQRRRRWRNAAEVPARSA